MQNSTSPSLLYYEYKGKLATVLPAKDHEEALAFAQEGFPELRHTPRNHISLYLRIQPHHGESRARISPSAWAPTIATLESRSLIFVEVETPLDMPSKDTNSDAPPQYNDHKSDGPPQPKLEKKWEFWRWKF